MSGQRGGNTNLAPAEGGPLVILPHIPAQTFEWSPDGKHLMYVRNQHGVGNIWSEPVLGGEAKQITHFTNGMIFQFAVARDSRLAVSRGPLISDAILAPDGG